ncbi:MAG: XdhC/CoxI family protein [Dehalococcoidia bacterium]|nr:XdhC family protein [Dehalococcoidia bacterium]MCB9486463.1 XdhC family protein [Thermoflexaceae bacterium]
MLELTRRLLSAADGSEEPVVMASVLETGERPLTRGSRLLVDASGATMGTLGDATLDALVVAYAPGAFRRHVAETLYVGAADTAAPEDVEGAPDVVDGLSLHGRTIAGATALYVEVVEHKPVFLVVGGGHIGRSLAKLAKLLDFHVAVIDDREEFASEERIPDADEVICEDFEMALGRFNINANTSVVMVTRGHKQDELSLRAVLGRGAGYVGMIGSKRRTGAVLEHLKEEGFDPADLSAVRTPIGLAIGAETPEEIAVSIMAEVIMLRRGGDGTPMYFRRGGPARG